MAAGRRGVKRGHEGSGARWSQSPSPASPRPAVGANVRVRLTITGIIVSLIRSLDPLKTPGWTALQAGGARYIAVYNGSVGYAVRGDGGRRGRYPSTGRAARQRRARQWVVGNIRQKNQLSVDREYLYCHRALFFCDASRPRMLYRFAGRVRVQHPVETPADQPPPAQVIGVGRGAPWGRVQSAAGPCFGAGP